MGTYSQNKRKLITAVPAGENVLIAGSPGGGKTSLIKEVAREIDHDLLLLHPIVDDTIDYKGLPGVVKVVNPDGTEAIHADFHPYGVLRQMMEAARPLLVCFDDLGQARPQVQAPIMQVIESRSINGKPISKYVRFVACTNRSEDAAGVQGLLTPLLDRFSLRLRHDISVEEWILGARENGVPLVLQGFVRFRPSLMSTFEGKRDLEKQPTPRSVAGLARLMNLGLDDLETFEDAVGAGFAAEFYTFLKVYRALPAMETIYNNPSGTDVPTEPSVNFALMTALAEHADEKNFAPTVEFITRCEPEYSVMCIKDILARKPGLSAEPAFLKWVKNHRAAFPDRF